MVSKIRPTTCRRKKHLPKLWDLRPPNSINSISGVLPAGFLNQQWAEPRFVFSLKSRQLKLFGITFVEIVKNLHPKVALYLGLAGDLITFPRKLSPFLIHLRNTFDNFGSKKQLRKTPTWHISSLGKKTPAARWFDHLSPIDLASNVILLGKLQRSVHTRSW